MTLAVRRFEKHTK